MSTANQVRLGELIARIIGLLHQLLDGDPPADHMYVSTHLLMVLHAKASRTAQG